MVDRFSDTLRFYELLAKLERRVGGTRVLADCTGGMRWPKRGLYFFFELEHFPIILGHILS